MKKIIFILAVVFCSTATGKTFKIDDYVSTISGFITYTRSTYDPISPKNDYSGILNTTISNEHGYISGQFSTNSYNHIRRLLVDVPIYVNGCNQIDVAFGRLTNSIGFINTNLHNSQVNGSILLPLSTYDPRRYTNLPDITDGGQITYTVGLEHVNLKIRGYAGKQVVDNPIIDVYSAKFGLIGKSDRMFGFDISAVFDNNTTLHYAFTDNVGYAIRTIPPSFINNIDTKLLQQIHFIGFQHYIDNLKIQGEATYRKLNTISDETGGNLSLSYNFKDNWDYYVGGSYGTRIKDSSTMWDVYTGISNTFHDITVSLEVHRLSLNKWYFEYKQPDNKTVPMALFSITYSF